MQKKKNKKQKEFYEISYSLSDVISNMKFKIELLNTLESKTKL